MMLVPRPQLCNASPYTSHRFGLVPVRSPLLRESRLISFPAGTEMFQFPGFASEHAYVFRYDGWLSPATGFPIRKSPDQRLCCTPRSLSQLPRPSSPPCQGIHRLLGIHHYLPLIKVLTNHSKSILL